MVNPYRRTIVAMVQGRHVRARLKDALSPFDEIVFVETIGQLRPALQSQVHAMTVIVEARDLAGESAVPLLRDLAERMPAVATMGYVRSGPQSADLLELATSGIDALIQEGVDDVGVSLRAAYRGGIEGCAARAVRSAVQELIPGDLRPMVDYVLQFPRADHSVEGLAHTLGCDRKTLLNHSTRSGLPAPSELVMWCRLLLAAAILESTGYPVERVADQLEFASPSAFRNACRRYTALRPSDWRSSGGLFTVVDQFRAAIRQKPNIPVA